MKKLIPLLFLLSACTKEDEYIPQKEYTFTIDSVLTQNCLRSLPKDQNGLYHLKITVITHNKYEVIQVIDQI